MIWKNATDIVGRLQCFMDELDEFLRRELKALRPANMHLPQLMLLYRVYQKGGSTITAMQDIVTGTRAELAQRIRLLHDGGYMTADLPASGRGAVFKATAKGVKLAEQVDLLMQKLEQEVGQNFARPQQSAVIHWMQLMAQDFKTRNSA